MKHNFNALQLIQQKPLRFFIGASLITLALVGVITTTAKIGSKSFAVFPPKIKTTLQKEKKIKYEYYTLQEGESLWDVAQKVYNDPYKYVRIIELNKITTADTLEKGTKLIVR